MSNYGKRDSYYSSKSTYKPSHNSRRDYEEVKSRSSHQYLGESRDDNYLKREHPRNQDHSSYKHSKYRNSKFYPSDRTLDDNRQYRRSRRPKHDDVRRNNDKDTSANASDEENGGDSSVFLKYQQKAWKSKAPDPSEADKRSSILIRCVDQEVTEEQVERVISEVAIKNGFSTPNSVQFRTFHTNTISGSLHSTDKNVKSSQYMEGYGYPYSLEKVAIVKFPSISAAGRFMASNKSRSIKIGGREYYIEYDTLTNDNAETVSQDTLMPAVAEIATLLQKRKMLLDWNCPSCRFLNFSKRSVCLACGVPKPSESEFETQNLAIELAALNQAQMLQSNLSDVAPWLILKNIPGDADPAKLVLTICKAVPEAPAQLQKCIYVIDTNSESKRGFMFAQFGSLSTVEKYMAKRGDKRSELVTCGNTYHRLDTVRSREKHVAEELFKKVKMASLKVNYEFDIRTSETNLSSEDKTMTQLNKEYRSCKVKTTNIAAIEQYVSSNETHTMSQVFYSNWIAESISLPSGKPDTGTFVYDAATDYFFDHKLSLYYDAATTYYMSLTGNYYLWDEQSKALKRVDPKVRREGSESRKASAAVTSSEAGKKESNSIANILASAMKVAKASQENVQQLSSVITEKNQGSKAPTVNKTVIGRTFELSDDSEGESDMELEGKAAKSETKASAGCAEEPRKRGAQAAQPQGRSKSVNICFVCLRKFDTPDNLNFHERESRYHRALIAHQQTRQN
ncbi:asparagine-rich protein [Theileria orientalis strain Shintoku]|uniref:Asparagine-rich protein n=1 Tax=Theileria orientalis strain Shintoku TaxID=869250 RepID=J4CDU0_THEOR|nr:asparagine-rich protein [Theileria orientalis strain Shintoku]BAM41727.1 asparagine-rich protein [Theileria orientalis strain Shintoku]|eukprot:XP_009692028.1 asparagine-rich protein [Theileria orientalis strain Shintoku]